MPEARLDRRVEISVACATRFQFKRLMDTNEPKSSLWPVTVLAEVEAAAGAVGRQAEPLEQLVLRYDRPLLLTLQARFRSFPKVLQDARDLLHEFYAARLLKDGWLAKYDASKGRFRTFLSWSLKNFAWDWWRGQPEYGHWSRHHKAETERARLGLDQAWDATPAAAEGDTTILPGGPAVGADLEKLPAPVTEDAAFTLAWLQDLMAEAMRRMEEHCTDARGQAILGLFQVRFLAPILEESKPPGYEVLCAQFGFRSPAEAQNALATGKRIFKRMLEATIVSYSARGSEAQAEMQVLREFIARLEQTGKTGGEE
jgi:hypothetical protein